VTGFLILNNWRLNHRIQPICQSLMTLIIFAVWRADKYQCHRAVRFADAGLYQTRLLKIWQLPSNDPSHSMSEPFRVISRRCGLPRSLAIWFNQPPCYRYRQSIPLVALVSVSQCWFCGLLPTIAWWSVNHPWADKNLKREAAMMFLTAMSGA